MQDAVSIAPVSCFNVRIYRTNTDFEKSRQPQRLTISSLPVRLASRNYDALKTQLASMRLRRGDLMPMQGELATHMCAKWRQFSLESR